MVYIDRYGEAAGAAISAIGGENKKPRLEFELKQRVKKDCVLLSSVDAAIHTALYLCDVTFGDYVFVPAFTFYSYIMPIEHMGGVPVFLDCDPVTRCVSVPALEAAFLWSGLQDKPPKAVVVDNAFGSVADYDMLMPLCNSFGVPLIELAADAFCGEYNGVKCGGNGSYGVIGFSKSLAGGGAALVCGDDRQRAEEFARIRYSDGENYDYAMNKVIAALDLAQLDILERIGKRCKTNLEILSYYSENVAPPVKGDAGAYALVKTAHSLNELRSKGYIVKKPPPVHKLERYGENCYFEHEPGYSVCDSFKEYCLIDMDLSAGKRRRLIKIIGNY